MTKKRSSAEKKKMVLTVFFTLIAIFYLLPIFFVLINSFKANAFVNTATFAMPNEESCVGWANYVKGAQRSLSQRRL